MIMMFLLIFLLFLLLLCLLFLLLLLLLLPDLVRMCHAFSIPQKQGESRGHASFVLNPF